MLLVRETRCGSDEVRHEGAVAISDSAGTVLLGDLREALPLRSIAKPFILAALLEHVLVNELFLPAELAVMSSSHNGEPQHVAVVLELLNRYGISPELVQCGVHDKWKDWTIQSQLGNNCSGKHAALLIASKVAGYPLRAYRDPSGPLWQFVTQKLTSCFGQPPQAFGVDGCSVPTWSFPLPAIATAFRNYANGALCKACESVRTAHRAAGYYVGGTDRLESYLITALGLTAKSGSDGMWAIGVPGADLGIAVKSWSGNEAAVQAVILDILDRRGLISIHDDPYLQPYHTRVRHSLVGSPVGMVEVCFLERP
jgi:L-asparaginase II